MFEELYLGWLSILYVFPTIERPSICEYICRKMELDPTLHIVLWWEYVSHYTARREHIKRREYDRRTVTHNSDGDTSIIWIFVSLQYVGTNLFLTDGMSFESFWLHQSPCRWIWFDATATVGPHFFTKPSNIRDIYTTISVYSELICHIPWESYSPQLYTSWIVRIGEWDIAWEFPFSVCCIIICLSIYCYDISFRELSWRYEYICSTYWEAPFSRDCWIPGFPIFDDGSLDCIRVEISTIDGRCEPWLVECNIEGFACLFLGSCQCEHESRRRQRICMIAEETDCQGCEDDEQILWYFCHKKETVNMSLSIDFISLFARGKLYLVSDCLYHLLYVGFEGGGGHFGIDYDE